MARFVLLIAALVALAISTAFASWAGGALESVPVPSQKPFEAQVSAAGVVPAKKPMPKGLEPISDKDVAVYKKIFALQAAGKIDAANREFTNLKDFRLRGHVLFQRYMHPTAYRSSFEELKNWMDVYADLPRAEKIYSLAETRMPAGFQGKLRKPEKAQGVTYVREPTIVEAKTYRTTKRRSNAQAAEVDKLTRLTFGDISRNSPTRALRRLKASPATAYMDAAEIDILKANIARGYIHAGKLDDALKLSAEAALRSSTKVPLAGWVGGQALWRMGDYDKAAKFFEITGDSEYASGWMASAGAFWAARCYMRTGSVREVNKWLRVAADHSHTFYGLIATRALGRDFDFNWEIPVFSKASYEQLARYPEGLRAMALAETGQVHLAEAELMRLNPRADKSLEEAMLAYAGYAGLPGLSYRLGNYLQPGNGKLYDAALYPKGPWEPSENYNLDSALIHAVMRQESRFDPLAESRSGAKGLMQIMPATASYVSGNSEYRQKSHQYKLLDPATNLEIGQKYLAQLLNLDYVAGDLFSLMVAYNAGPGNLRKWKREDGLADDPLLFIESIPVAETRIYVERVIANYWIYRMRERQRTPSLDAVAKGKWAVYAQYNGDGEEESPQRSSPTRSVKVAYN